MVRVNCSGKMLMSTNNETEQITPTALLPRQALASDPNETNAAFAATHTGRSVSETW